MYEAVVLGIGLVIAILSIWQPIPYGRFQLDLPLQLPNRWYLFLVNLPALVALLIAGEGFTSKELGLIAILLFSFHFFLRAVFVPFIVSNIYTVDKKQVSFLTVIVIGTYNAFVGLMLGHMCQRITRSPENFDIALIVGAVFCLLLNVVYDIYINYLRVHGEVEMNEMYVAPEEIAKLYRILDYAGLTSPNYVFEILEWLLFTIVLWNIEMVVYLLCTVLILWIRAVAIQDWSNKV
jgi:hypothetical protein